MDAEKHDHAGDQETHACPPQEVRQTLEHCAPKWNRFGDHGRRANRRPELKTFLTLYAC
jgi:hypothetical protein